MSYRKKRHPSKTEPAEQQTLIPEVKYNNPGVSRDLSTAKLTSGLPYQRPVETEDVDRLIAKWDDKLLTPVVVSFRDGNFNVVDGQHRIAAMRKMAGGGDVIVPCIIYTGLTYISKKDYQDLKKLYTGRAEQAQEAIDLLREEMERVSNNSSVRLRWTQHFKAFSAMTTLDRRAVIAMIQSIQVKGKNDLVITFRYQIEYAQVLERLNRLDKLPPDLREILTVLTQIGKEAA